MARTRTLYTATLLAAAALSGGCSSSDSTQAPTYQAIGSFSDSQTKPLAPVQRDGKWGFIDENGSLVVTPQYTRVLPFREGLAGIESSGRWGFINESFESVITPRFYSVQSFSSSLAPASSSARGSFGFINKQGAYTIQPQYKNARGFVLGLAPVKKADGSWVFINTSGTEVLKTGHHHVSAFVADGLARVRPVKGGLFGFMDISGALKLPAIYEEAGDFSEGMAPVKINGVWGYIDTAGTFLIQPTYRYAGIFSGGLAPVGANGKFFYIDRSGKQAFSDTYDHATSFVGGKALVKAGNVGYYIDKDGKKLAIAQTASARTAPGDSIDCAVGPGVYNNWEGGFTKFSLINTDTGPWDISYKNLQPEGWRVTLIPGGPSQLPAVKGTGYTLQSFMAYVPSMASEVGRMDGTTWPHFEMDLTNSALNATVTISNYGIYNAPPSSDGGGFKWFDLLRGTIDILKGTLDLADGDIFGGLYDFSSGAYDLVSGTAGDSSTSNKMPFGDGTFYVSNLSGKIGDKVLNSLTGSFCGGDSYTLSDGNSLVVEMSATRGKEVPGQVDVKFYRYNTFFALQTMNALNNWRQPSNDSNGMYLTGPYADLMKLVFANYTDPTDTTPYTCTNGSGATFLSMFMDGSLFAGIDLGPINFWNNANNFNFIDTDTINTWVAQINKGCGMVISPTSFNYGVMQGGCPFQATATGTAGPITTTTSYVNLSPGSCTSAQASCTFNFSVGKGFNGPITVTDGKNSIQLHAICGGGF